MFQLILGYMVCLRPAWDTRDSATKKMKIKPQPKVWKRNFLWKKHYLGWPCRFSGAPCISYSETHQNRDSMVDRGSFKVTALDCTVFKVQTNSKSVSYHREGSRQREELLPGMVRINTLVPSSWTFIWDRTFMGCFCLVRPGLFGCLSSCSAWSRQSRTALQTENLCFRTMGVPFWIYNSCVFLARTPGDLVSFSLPSWVEVLLRYLWKGSIQFGRGPAEFSAISKPKICWHSCIVSKEVSKIWREPHRIRNHKRRVHWKDELE